MRRFKERGTGYETSADDKKLYIDIPISTLACAFNHMPDNEEGTAIKKGKRREFAELVAEHLHDEVDSETGATFITEMFDKLFTALCEGYIDTRDVIKFPDND